MYLLTQTEFCLEAEPALRKVFVNDDCTSELFSSNIATRVIVYPCTHYVEPPYKQVMELVLKRRVTTENLHCYDERDR
jgi:hypothetical protein